MPNFTVKRSYPSLVFKVFATEYDNVTFESIKANYRQQKSSEARSSGDFLFTEVCVSSIPGSVQISGEGMNSDLCIWYYFAKRQSARAVGKQSKWQDISLLDHIRLPAIRSLIFNLSVLCFYPADFSLDRHLRHPEIFCMCPRVLLPSFIENIQVSLILAMH